MSGERFTATNGWYVEDGILRVPSGDPALNVLPTRAQALMEYGAHKALADRDTALGRWRSVEHPDFVVYRSNSVNSARLIWETSGRSVTAQRTSDGLVLVDGIGQWRHVAVEYFAAHPVGEPKPWEHAEPGQLWMLIAEGVENEYATILGGRYVAESHLYFVPTRAVTLVKLGLTATVITAGRRIYPEVTS